jgi:hypothetical protein
MDSRQTRQILERLAEIERTTVRYRQGVVTDTSPLTVALGGATGDYTNVRALKGPEPLAVDDVVAVLMFGFDMLVLGAIGDGT